MPFPYNQVHPRYFLGGGGFYSDALAVADQARFPRN